MTDEDNAPEANRLTADEETLALQEKVNAADDSYEAVRLAAEHALQRLKATTVESKQTAKAISKVVHEDLRLTLPIARGTFGPYLSTIVGSAKSAITSAGRGSAGGYYLFGHAEPATAQSGDAGELRTQTHTKFEEQLYPVFHRWLVGQGYNARVTASMRTLGKWSNPDVTGIRVSEHFGRFDIEVATIEVKKDLQNWERHFFEAVSHRRYANRAYFAFPLPESMQGKLPDDMRYYSELYNVGVLTLILSDAEHEAYVAGKPIQADDEYVSDVVEVLTNRSTQVPMGYQRRFCEALEIRDIQGLLTWGE
jgi:hypothetical protein